MSAALQIQRKVSTALAQPPFPSRLLGSLGKIEKLPEARKPILSNDSSVIYLATYAESSGITQMQAIEAANARGLTLVSNKGFDRRLLGENAPWRGEKDLYPVWTGTFVACERAGKPLGPTIEFSYFKGPAYVFPVPMKAQLLSWLLLKFGMNVALAINHGFTENGKPLISYRKIGDERFLVEIADSSRIRIIADFPTERSGWYLAHEKSFGIPTGRSNIPVGKANEQQTEQSRHFQRAEYSAYVGLLQRGYFYYNGELNVMGAIANDDHIRSLRSKLSGRFGALAYAKQK